MPMRSTLMGMLRGQPWPDRPRPRGPIAPSLLIPQHLSAPAVRVQQVHLLTHLVYPDAASTRQREDVAAEATYHNRKHPQLVPAPWNHSRHKHTSPPRPGHFRLVVRAEERHRPPSTGLERAGNTSVWVYVCSFAGCTRWWYIRWEQPFAETSWGSGVLEWFRGVLGGASAQGPVKGEVGVTSWFSHRGALRWGRRYCEHRTRCHASSGSLRPHSTNYGYRGTS